MIQFIRLISDSFSGSLKKPCWVTPSAFFCSRRDAGATHKPDSNGQRRLWLLAPPELDFFFCFNWIPAFAGMTPHTSFYIPLNSAESVALRE